MALCKSHSEKMSRTGRLYMASTCTRFLGGCTVFIFMCLFLKTVFGYIYIYMCVRFIYTLFRGWKTVFGILVLQDKTLQTHAFAMQSWNCQQEFKELCGVSHKPIHSLIP